MNKSQAHDEGRVTLPPDGRRLIYDLSAFGLPEIPYLAAQNVSQTAPGLPTHYHAGRMEINHFLKGERTYRVGGKDCHLRGNQVFVTWPDEVHGTGSYLHGRGVHFWMQIELPRPGRRFLGFGGGVAEPLLERLWGMPRRQFRAHPGMRGLYGRILGICQRGPTPLSCIELAALLTQWLLLLMSAAGSGGEDEVTADIGRALELATGEPMRPHSVAELAEAACLSESHFKIKFQRQVGVPPGDFLLRRRVEAGARMLLRGGGSVTDVGFDLGFSSSQHFCTTFKKFFGVSPLAWVKEQRREPVAGTGKKVGRSGKREPWIEDGVFHGYLSSEEEA